MKVAVEHIFNGEVVDIDNYDPDKTTLGKFLKQYSGTAPVDNYISSEDIVRVDFAATSTIPQLMPHVIEWDDRYSYVLTGEASFAAVTRRFVLYRFDKRENLISYLGFITVNTALSGNKSIRALRGCLYRHTSGTVSANASNTIIGNGTQFINDRIAVGARIGFGSTNPSNIDVWYDITAITNNQQLNIAIPVTVPNNTPYVIEEFRIVFAFTNSVVANGGIGVVKGLNQSTFTGVGTLIPDATADNQRAFYWLVDEDFNNLRLAYGIGLLDEWSANEHIMYVNSPDTTTAARLYKMNVRSPLTLSGNKSSSAFIFKTSLINIVGSISAVNNGRVFEVRHGTAAFDKSFYFVTNTRIYRCSLNAILENSDLFISDFMLELPLGGSTTYSVTSAISQVDYSATIDRLIITTISLRMYISKYDTSGNSTIEKIFNSNLLRLQSTNTDTDAPKTITATVVPSIWSDGGRLYMVPSSTSTATATLIIFPFSVDMMYAEDDLSYIVTPKIPTPNNRKFNRIYINNSLRVGSDAMGLPTETFAVYYRTSGFDSLTGNWFRMSDDKNISHVGGTEFIQFKIMFEILGITGIASRIYSIGCIYEDELTDIHYLPSYNNSSVATNTFAWKQVALWTSDVPTLQIIIRNTDTNFLILVDNTAHQSYGIFEYSIDGGNVWNAWNPTINIVGAYIRYIASILPNNVSAKVSLVEL